LALAVGCTDTRMLGGGAAGIGGAEGIGGARGSAAGA
jgi:hypothetical protein